MGKKAIIFDLDNTIYAVHSIGAELFAPLFQLIDENGNHVQDFEKIKDDIMRMPFQLVASHYLFSDKLTKKGIELLQNLTHQGKIEPFDDYQLVKNITLDKYLVTTGFTKLQQSKISGMNLEPDFKEVHIVDPTTSAKTKKDVFADILERHGYNEAEVLIIGDDLNSEIRAAQDLGIDAILYDKLQMHDAVLSCARISDFKQLASLIT